MKTLKWIGHTLGKRQWLIVVMSVIQSVLAVTGILFALLMRQIIDNAVDGNKGDFYGAILALASVMLMQIALRWILRFVEDDTRAAIENRLRQRTFGEILRTER